jgi:acyl-CoA reductase-like NAD-dependent aldehyde dehydrogenase
MSATAPTKAAPAEGLREVREYRNYINGEWVASSGGKVFENRNPANSDDLVGTFQESNADDLNAAVDAADKAYETWRLTPAPKRAEYLYRVGAILQRDKDKIAREMTREMGKVFDETKGDVQEAIDMAYLAAGEGRRLFGVTTPSELPNKFNMAVRMPLGVAGLITPWNFPIAIPAWKGMAALICGNTVVIKPASLTPLSVIMLAEAFEEAGLPKGVWNVVTGGGREVGEPMTRHEKVKVISFTGSTGVGRDINVACAPTFKRVHLEMGGNHGSGRRRRRPGRRRRAVGGIRHGRAALHGGVAHRRSEGRVRPVRGEARRPREEAARRQRPRPERRHGTERLRVAAQNGRVVREDRHR